MWLVWILSSGSRHFIESCSSTENSTSRYHDFTESLEFKNISKSIIPVTILRELSCKLPTEKFRKMLYACLTGIQMVVRGPENKTLEVLYALSSLVPRSCRRIIINANEFHDNNECNFLGNLIFKLLSIAFLFFIN